MLHPRMKVTRALNEHRDLGPIMPWSLHLQPCVGYTVKIATYDQELPSYEIDATGQHSPVFRSSKAYVVRYDSK
jgi:hypothetical protein